VAAAEPRAARAWFVATVLITVVPVVVAAMLAPAGRSTTVPGLVWLLFVGSAMHIGATAWFYAVPEVRGFMADHPGRYLVAPVVLVLGGALLAAALSAQAFTVVLLAFFAWQFHHFQKQNLGVAALAARAFGARGLSLAERRVIVACGVGGIVVLLGRPGVLDLSPSFDTGYLVPIGTTLYVVAAMTGLALLARRNKADRPREFVAMMLVALAFFAPVVVFDRPFAAVAGVTIAHGLQYLLLVGMLAAAPTPRVRPAVGVLIFAHLALVVGFALNRASHLHGGGPGARAIYGGYVGVLTAHFVIDAGLWRLRDAFPRSFLSARLPYLLEPETVTVSAR